jgi:prepilin-type N-terminal cleavage/methylation domain-containing protein
MIVRRGTTLVELLIVIALMSLLSGVVVLALHPPASGGSQTPSQLLADSLRLTASDLRARSVAVGDSDAAVVLPDGRIIADPVFHADILVGLPSHAR